MKQHAQPAGMTASTCRTCTSGFKLLWPAAVSLSIGLMLSGTCLDGLAQVSNVLQRVSNTTLKMPITPQSFGFALENAFGNLTFSAPVSLRTPPGETNRIFVVEQGGLIWVITNLTTPNKTLFLDLSKQVAIGDIAGLTAMAFHPGYSTNGFFFLGYNLNTTTAAGKGGHYRVSRFSVSSADPNLGIATNELPLITQFGVSGMALCDDMTFGSDSFLYISVADPFSLPSGGVNTAQRIDADLFGGVLRIDVDRQPGSLPPNPHPAVTTNYAIPADNPFIGATNYNGAVVDPANVRTEFYAIGLRNPWRMFFDAQTRLLYVGDPGLNTFDEINVIYKGANYGWPFREGIVAGPQASHAPPGFSSVNPIYQFGDPAAVIGGVVYHGQRMPSLQDAFIFGDWENGTIRALRYGGTNSVPAQTLVTEIGIASFGVDPSNGDVLPVNHDSGVIRRLTYSAKLVGTPLPATLALTGAFADLAALTPSPGIVPYEVNLPSWADNALTRRWFAVQTLSQTFGFSRDNNWLFPNSTVWIQQFDLELTNGVPGSTQRVETRMLVRNAGGFYGMSYRWDPSQTNATLVPEAGLDDTFTIQDGGLVRTQTWHYPGRAECLSCHTPLAGYALGFNTAQLNRDHDYGNGTANQIRALSDAGYFSTKVAGIYALPALAQPTNSSVSLDYRVHSYLAANCAHCHQPGGRGLARFDARLFNLLSAPGLINGALFDTLEDPANLVIKPGSLAHSAMYIRLANLGEDRMPPLATSLLDPTAIRLFGEWITNGLTNYRSFADWQATNFGSTNAPNAQPDADPDGDGANNYLEFLMGTNPSQAGDAWTVGIHMAETGPEISFPRIANRAFEVQWTTNLSNLNSWSPLDVPGNAQLFSITNSQESLSDLLAAPGKFYRVRVREP
jgi:glucose/arabinose dehydrogenase